LKQCGNLLKNTISETFGFPLENKKNRPPKMDGLF